MALKRKRYSYEEMAKVGRKYYNDTGFCGVVALASAAQVPFGLAKKTLERHEDVPAGFHREHRQGCHWFALEAALKALGCKVDCPRNSVGRVMARDYEGKHEWVGKTVRNVEKAAPKGLYMIYVDRHVLFMEDGIINDWTEIGLQKRMGKQRGCMRKINLVWKIEREFDAV